MASTVIQPVATKLCALLNGLTPAVNTPGSGWARDHLRKLPAAELEVPDLGFSDLEEPESQLGSDDWTLDYVVTIWCDLREPTSSATRLIDLVEQWRRALAADATLAGLVQEAKLVEAKRVYGIGDKSSRTLLGYETTVRVHVLVANP